MTPRTLGYLSGRWILQNSAVLYREMMTEQSSLRQTRPTAAVFGRRNRPDGLDALKDSFMAHLRCGSFTAFGPVAAIG